MFDFLNDVNSDDLLGAASFAVRTLTHMSREGGAVRLLILPKELSPRQLALGRKIVKAIEAGRKRVGGSVEF